MSMQYIIDYFRAEFQGTANRSE